MKKKALFLDRDGVINIDTGYLYKIEDFRFVEGVLDFIKSMQDRGFRIIVVTNQSGIGRGYYSLNDFEKVTDYMIEKMRQNGIDIDKEDIFFCPHTPENGCSCRKPEPDMILSAIEKFDIDAKESILIGDKTSDIESAKRAGIGRAFLVPKNTPSKSWNIDI